MLGVGYFWASGTVKGTIARDIQPRGRNNRPCEVGRPFHLTGPTGCSGAQVVWAHLLEPGSYPFRAWPTVSQSNAVDWRAEFPGPYPEQEV